MMPIAINRQAIQRALVGAVCQSASLVYRTVPLSFVQSVKTELSIEQILQGR